MLSENPEAVEWDKVTFEDMNHEEGQFLNRQFLELTQRGITFIVLTNQELLINWVSTVSKITINIINIKG
ncbi:MAG: hypothetical protein GX654_01380 [Desulfatiglans sp.]|jgi:hypothetical protein|nr:hypothetical protein [Desulfatiglans sp.]